MDADSQVKCRKCKKPARFNELKNEDNIWMCYECYEKMHMFPEQKSVSFKQERPQSVSKATVVQDPQMKIYTCLNCSYNIKRGNFDVEKICPYCGDRGTIRLAK